MVHLNIRLFKLTLVLTAVGLVGTVATHSSVSSANGTQAPALAPAQEGIEFFEKKIRPVLTDNCYQCHSAQAGTPQGGLLLDSREAMRKGGVSGQAAIIPGDPDNSLLIRAIRYTDPNLQMPPGGKLPDRVIRDFEEWVKMGAPDPRGANAPNAMWQAYDFDEAKKFWSFQPVKDRQPPRVENEAWVRTPVDRFIRAKLEEKKLKPVADADRRTLIRRATFDLTGLPPTPREIDGFLTDQSPNAFEKVVDRLLASSAYGERWGRHWLDLVRYADTAGCNSDFPVPQAYKYRNYVIRAFNEDKPYDEFIREQIAGDLLPHKDEADRFEKIVATGYIAISRRFGSRDTDHNLAIDDTIDNVGKAFLGLTTSCARCHDHKFDPIPTKDYYALYGIFASTRYPFPGTEIYPHPHSLVPLTNGNGSERLEKYQKEAGELELKKEALQVERGYARGRQRQKETGPEVVTKAAGKTVKTDQIGRIIAIGKLIEEDHDDRNLKIAEASTRTVEQIEEELKLIKLRLAELGEAPKLDKAYAVAEGAPADARIHRKGDNKNLGEIAPRGFLTILGGQHLPDGYKGSGRLELAKWLSSAENPLTSRVIVNRVWLYHFGKGLVQTPNDWGKRGAAPTHAELLDYLAARFVAGGWSIKRLHRELMLSRVYQLGSGENAANAGLDAANNYLWRFNRRRLDAEEIRDAMLAVSGALEQDAGGPHPFPPESLWRYSQHNPFVAVYEHNGRGIYLMQQRIRAHPQLSIFDGADTNTPTGERVLSTTPLQALFMMNNPFAHKQADNLAVRVGLAFADDTRRIDYAYRLALGRPPTPAESKRGLEYLRDIRPDLTAIGVEEEAQTRAALASYLRVLVSSSEFIFVD